MVLLLGWSRLATSQACSQSGPISTTTQVCADNSKFVTMSNTAQSSWGFTNLKSESQTTLTIDKPDNVYWSAAFDLTVVVDITYYDEANTILYNSTGTSTSVTGVNLKVSYDPASGVTEQVLDLKKVPDAYKVTVSVISTSLVCNGTCPGGYSTLVYPYITLTTTIEEERALVNPSFSYTSLSTNNTSAAGYVTVNWNTFDDILATELEWMWIDEYDNRLFVGFESDGNYATRVRLAPDAISYNIPDIYEQGYIIFRVRPVYACGSAYDKECTGSWTVANGTGILMSEVKNSTRQLNGNPALIDYIAVSGHQSDLNWTYNLALAEEGKHKAIVGYADGMLRPRQMVTKLNSANNDHIVVAESIFDHVGRNAISVLPVPVESSQIAYTANFTRNADEEPYTWRDFEVAIDCESPVPGIMSTNSGAAMYYSSNNNSTQDHKDYIPDAHGYPFATTQYENNPGGLVKKQGGLGYVHRLEGDHATRYYYGQPNQEELDRLFGTDVGYAQNYSKVITVDANGQRSIAIYDMAGNVIATALEGPVPGNLNALGNAYQVEDVDLMPANEVTVEGGNDLGQSRNITNSSLQYYIYAEQGDYTVDYSFKPEKYTADCQLITGLCYDCIYDLRIEIYDLECNTLIDHYETSIGPADYMEASYDPNCDPTSLTATSGLVLTNLAEGYYKITKTLTLREDAIDFFADKYVEDLLADRETKLAADPEAETCVKTLNDFLKEELEQIDWRDCFYSCEECQTELADILTQYGAESDEYKAHEAVCNQLCGGTPCEAGWQAMLADVSPGGQYASYKTVVHDDQTDSYTETLYDFVDGSGYTQGTFSLLNERNKLPIVYFTDNGTMKEHSGYSWRKPMGPNADYKYRNEDGTESLFLIDGSLKGPEHFKTVQEFIDNWQPSWARSLVYYHPEYIYYEYCESIDASGSNDFDEYLQQIGNYSDAFDLHLFDPLDLGIVGSIVPANYQGEIAKFTDGDPFFASGGPGNAYRSEMIDKMEKYVRRPDNKDQSTNDGYFNIWEYAAFMAYCIDISKPADRDQCIDDFTFAMASTGNVCQAGNEQDMWRYFRAFYWQAKQEIITRAQHQFAFENHGFNGCIGMNKVDYMGSDLIHDQLDEWAATMGGSHSPVKRKWKLTTTAPFAVLETHYNYRNDPRQTCMEVPSAYARLDAFSYKTKRYAHNVYTSLEFSTQAANDLNTLKGELEDKIEASSTEGCAQQCSTKTLRWMESLRDCAEGQLLTWESGNTEYDDMYTALYDLCNDNCGYDDYFGSSGPNGSDFGTDLETRVKDIIYNNPGATISLDCYGDIVEAEAAGIFGDQFASYLDDCGCDLLTSVQTEYENLVACNAHNGQSLEDYLLDVKGISVDNAYDLLCKCEEFASTELGILKIPVPSALTCTACPSCYQLDKVVFDFKCEYAALITGGTFQYLDLDNDAKRLFTDYANLRLNLSLSISQYEQAFDCCDIYACDIDNDSHRAHYWREFLNHLTTKQKVKLPVNAKLQWKEIGKTDPDFSDFYEFIYCEGTEAPDTLSNDYYVAFQKYGNKTFGLIIPSSSYTAGTPVTFSAKPYSAMFSIAFMDVSKSIHSPVRNGYDIEDIQSYDHAFVYEGMSNTRAIMDVTMSDGYCARVVFEMNYVLPDVADPNNHSCDLSIHSCGGTAICSGMGSNPGNGPYALADIEWPSEDGDFGIDSKGFIATFTDEGERTATDYLVHFSYEEGANFGSSSYRGGIGQMLSDLGISASISYTECATNCDECGSSEVSICCSNGVVTDEVEDLMSALSSGDAITNQLTNSTDGAIFTVSSSATSTTNLNNWLRPAACTETSATYTTDYYESGAGFLEGSIAFGTCATCSFHLRTSAENFDFADITAIQSLTYDPDGLSSYHANNFKMVVTTGSSYCFEGATTSTITIYGYSTCWELTTCASIQLVCDRGVSMPVEDPCISSKLNNARANALRKYNRYLAALKEDFKASYRSQCILDIEEEYCNADMGSEQEHYTLYYYDQARNLVRTVPPEGVSPIALISTKKDDIANHRADPVSNLPVEPSHTLQTTYQYNSLRAMTEQETPDAGIAEFWYDEDGRLIFSQNAKQKDAFSGTNDEHYSYTLYDDLGRIEEVGQIKINVVTYDMSEINIKSGNGPSIITLNNGNKAEVTKTFYDQETTNTDVLAKFGGSQDHLELRVASIAIKNDGVPTTTDYDHATYYSYDIFGNVKTLVHDLKELEAVGSHLSLNLGYNLKRIDYKYDLVSGNVHQVDYQSGEADGYHHRYEYDADNRIIDVQISYDGSTWSQDARYKYYDHGPLSRMELGAERVQGSDYAYNIMGWIKAMNGNFLDRQHEMGQDGYVGAGNQYTAHDAFGFVLGYFEGANNNEDDYTPIDASGSAQQVIANPGTFTSLYNGNIGYMSINHSVTMPNHGALNQTYTYDQLNRLRQMQCIDGMDMASLSWSINPGDYREAAFYDGNGNITSLARLGDATQHKFMDNLSYSYYAGTNKLKHVSEGFPVTSGYADDFEDMGANDYIYDEIGNLVQDLSEQIQTIDWTAYGKVKSVQRTSPSSSKPDMDFSYGATGNRVTKTVKNGATPDEWTRTYYVRDAQGNVMATYTSQIRDNAGNWQATYSLEEQHLYGSKRLGVRKAFKELFSHEVSNGALGTDIWDYTGQHVGQSTAAMPGNEAQQVRGDVRYEISDHLGNVRSVISDRKLPIPDVTFTNVDYYSPDVVTAQDYYPFGSLMPGRQYTNANFSDGYRYAFNGKEQDPEWNGVGAMYDYGFRIYDPRIAKFLSVDPLAPHYPWYTPYQFAGNSPILNVDVDGLEPHPYMYLPKWARTVLGIYEGSPTESKTSKAPGVTANLIHGQVSVDGKWVYLDDLDPNDKGKWVPVPSQQYVDQKYREVKRAIKNAKAYGSTYAAANLEHWLNGSGTHVTMPKVIRSTATVKSMKETNINRFKYKPHSQTGQTMLSVAGNLATGQSTTYQDFFHTNEAFNPFSGEREFYYAYGTVSLKSELNVSMQKGTDGVTTITGTVTHTVYDTYNWNPGGNTPMPPGPSDRYVPSVVYDNDMLLLEVYKGAQSFDMSYSWVENVNITLDANGKIISETYTPVK